MAKLKDSGERRQFESGAVRDISEGKGRCDLLPLDAVGLLVPAKYGCILIAIDKFQANKDVTELTYAINRFAEDVLDCDIFTLIIEVSKHYEDGAKKYAENNWMKGINLHCFIDSGVRHLLKYARGDQDEPHDRAFVWNMLGAIWTAEHRPDLDDIRTDLTIDNYLTVSIKNATEAFSNLRKSIDYDEKGFLSPLANNMEGLYGATQDKP